jgi:hypothetical protein
MPRHDRSNTSRKARRCNPNDRRVRHVSVKDVEPTAAQQRHNSGHDEWQVTRSATRYVDERCSTRAKLTSELAITFGLTKQIAIRNDDTSRIKLANRVNQKAFDTANAAGCAREAQNANSCHSFK